MSRISMIIVNSIASAFACFVGIAIGIIYDTPIVAGFGAVAAPVISLYWAGLRIKTELLNLAACALIGWTLGLVFVPVITESQVQRERRIAADWFVGKGWYIQCAVFSCVTTSIEIVFIQVQHRKRRQ